MRPQAAFQTAALLRRSAPLPPSTPRCTLTMASAGRYAALLLPIVLILLAAAKRSSDAPLFRARSTSSGSGHVVVYSTAPSAEVASKLASALVRARLVACVNTVPGVSSTYWWQGKVESEQEHLLIMKTRAGLVDEVSAAVKELHPFDTPEVVAQPVVGGLKKYLDWIDESTKEPGAAAKPQ